MLGVDLGLNVGSVTRVKKKNKKWFSKDHLVLKFEREKDSPKRIDKIAKRFYFVIKKMAKGDIVIAVEEPVLSWGRRNPKAYEKSVALFTLVSFLLRKKGFTIVPVNNRTAKKRAGYGGKDKEGMIKSYRQTTGVLPGHKAKYGMETLADSYFIALAGYDIWATNRDERKS
jgi:Holliday junction resolvasome RuvABC endonuclease subunit